MSYNQGYGQSGSQGYGQYNPYSQNPYDQRDDNQSQGRYNAPSQGYAQGNPYAQQGGYSQQQQQQPPQRPEYQQQSSSRYDEERQQGGYEMGAMGGRPNNNSNDPNRILNEVRAIDAEITELESRLDTLLGMQLKSLEETEQKAEKNPLVGQVENFNADVMSSFKGLTARIKTIKQKPESGHPRNAPQVGRVDRRLRAAVDRAQRNDKRYRDESQKMFARAYRIIDPNASDATIREAESSIGNQQIFSQAILSTNRRGEAQAVMNHVRDRQERLQKIERSMAELLQLVQDLEAAVIQQEDQVIAIEDKAADAEQHVTQATVELDGAVKKAKAARKKKWICLGIVILIIIIAIAVGVGVWKANSSPPRPRA